MTNLKTWTGSAYADVKDLRTGPARTPGQDAYVWNGSAFVKVWERPAVYRLVKAGTQSGSGTTWGQLTNLSPDAAYPRTIGSGTNLLIPPMAPPFTGVASAQIPHSGGISPYTQARIVKNSSVIVEGAQSTASSGTATASITTTCAPGDTFTIEWRGEGSFFNRPTAQAGAYLSIAPA